MSLSKLEIERIAHLARLEIHEDEITLYQNQLSNILSLDKQLETIDTEKVAPMAHPFDLDLPPVLRADEVTGLIDRDIVMQQAPVSADAVFYLVPKVIE